MGKVIWRNEALDQIDTITDYIRQFDVVAARDIGDKLIDLGESLAVFSNRGRPGLRGARELVTVPPYVLSYEVGADAVYIVSIRHGARRPRD